MDFNVFVANCNTFYLLIKLAKKTIILPTGTKLYHGTVGTLADKIKQEGFLRSDMWTRQQQEGKISGGLLPEEGLIWFDPNPSIAESFALGQELSVEKARKIGFPGGFADRGTVFEIVIQKPLKLIERGEKLTEEEARILAAINPRQHYDPIEPGTSLRSAISKLWQWEAKPQGFREVLAALGYDGFVYEKSIAILADKLPISGYRDIELNEEQKENSIEHIKQWEEVRQRKEKQQENKIAILVNMFYKLATGRSDAEGLLDYNTAVRIKDSFTKLISKTYQTVKEAISDIEEALNKENIKLDELLSLDKTCDTEKRRIGLVDYDNPFGDLIIIQNAIISVEYSKENDIIKIVPKIMVKRGQKPKKPKKKFYPGPYTFDPSKYEKD